MRPASLAHRGPKYPTDSFIEAGFSTPDPTPSPGASVVAWAAAHCALKVVEVRVREDIKIDGNLCGVQFQSPCSGSGTFPPTGNELRDHAVGS